MKSEHTFRILKTSRQSKVDLVANPNMEDTRIYKHNITPPNVRFFFKFLRT